MASILSSARTALRGLALLLLAAPVSAGEGPGLELLLPDGDRVVERRDQVDVFARDGRREAYGVRRPDGSVDLFNLDGTRRATIMPGIAGQPPRVTVPKGKR